MSRRTSNANRKEHFLCKKFKDLFNKHQFLMGVASSLAATAIISLISSLSIVKSIPDRFNEMESNLSTLTEELPTLSQDLSTLQEETSKNFENISSDLTSSLTDMNSSLSDLEESTKADIDSVKEELQQDINKINDKLFNLALNVTPINNTANLITQTINSIETEDNKNIILLDNSAPIAIDHVTSKEYTASQLAEQKLFMPYLNEKKQEVFFLGQFNKDNQWDGDCIINIYEKDNLILITEGKYNDGRLLSYRQVFPFTTSTGVNVWCISEREIIRDDSNSNENNEIDIQKIESSYTFNGESLTYFANDENKYQKNFTLEDASALNIVTVEQFKSTISSPLEGYYFGNTSDGKYNDNTGTSYMIKYFEDGTVRTLYHGNFLNGTFNDDSNSAWLIAKEQNTTYMYYKGKFKDEKPLHNEGSKFENYLTSTRIKELLIENDFYLDLNWDQSHDQLD